MEVSSKRPGQSDLRAGCLSFIELSAIAVANIAPNLPAVLIMPLMYCAAGTGSWLAYLFGAMMLLFVTLNLESVREAFLGNRVDACVHGDAESTALAKIVKPATPEMPSKR